MTNLTPNLSSTNEPPRKPTESETMEAIPKYTIEIARDSKVQNAAIREIMTGDQGSESFDSACGKILINAVLNRIWYSIEGKTRDSEKENHTIEQMIRRSPEFFEGVNIMKAGVEKKLSTAIIPAIAEETKYQAMAVISNQAMSMTTLLYVITTWMNENARPNFGEFLAIIAGSMACGSIPHFIKESGEKKAAAKLSAAEIVVDTRFANPNYPYTRPAANRGDISIRRYEKRTKNIFARLPEKFAQEIKSLTSGKIAAMKWSMFGLALSAVAPVVYDKAITEPAEMRFEETMEKKPIEAIQTLDGILQLPEIIEKIAARIAQESGKKEIEMIRDGDTVDQISLKPNFFQGSEFKKSSGKIQMENLGEVKKYEFIETPEVNGWVSKAGDEVLIKLSSNNPESPLEELGLNEKEIEECFGAKTGTLGVRIGKNHVQEVVIVRTDMGTIKTVKITPKSSWVNGHLIYEDSTAIEIQNKGLMNKVARGIEKLEAEIKKQAAQTATVTPLPKPKPPVSKSPTPHPKSHQPHTHPTQASTPHPKGSAHSSKKLAAPPSSSRIQYRWNDRQP